MPISFFPERDLKNIIMFLPLLDFHARPRLKMIFLLVDSGNSYSSMVKVYLQIFFVP